MAGEARIMTPEMWKAVTPFIVPLIIVAFLARRVMRAQRAQRIRPSRLWIAPVYVAVAMSLVLATGHMPPPYAFALFAVATAIGAVVGYLRAKHQIFSIDPATGNVMSKASPVATMLFIGLFVVRFGLNFYMRGGMASPGGVGQAQGAHLILYTDAMLFFAFAMLAVSAWEIWRRTRPLVAAKPPAPAAEPSPPPLP
jgi:hypothetical protein